MTNRTEKAIEAAAKVLFPEVFNRRVKTEYVDGYKKGERLLDELADVLGTIDAVIKRTADAIAAYEAAMWRPVGDHDGSTDPVLLELDNGTCGEARCRAHHFSG